VLEVPFHQRTPPSHTDSRTGCEGKPINWSRARTYTPNVRPRISSVPPPIGPSRAVAMCSRICEPQRLVRRGERRDYSHPDFRKRQYSVPQTSSITVITVG
jgi:hypothetical protein